MGSKGRKAVERKNSKLRNFVVVGFALLSLALVFVIWADRLINTEPEIPSYVRSTFSAPTLQGYDLTLTAQPTREHGEGHGSGQGGGEHGLELTPSPTFDVDSWVPEEDISDDLADE